MPHDDPLEISPENKAKILTEVRQVISNLHLQHYCQILGIDELQVTEQVSAWQRESNHKVTVSDLAYREISQLVYEAIRHQAEDIYNGAYGWLASYLQRIFYRLTHKQWELSEDLAAEAVTKIISKITTCESPYSFLAWCKQIAYREYLMYLRKNKLGNSKDRNSNKGDRDSESKDSDEKSDRPGLEIRQIPLDSLEGQMLEAGPVFDPLRKALSREQLDQLLKCIKNIRQTKRADNYRRILIETLFRGTRLEDLVEELGLPIEELRRQQTDAWKQLQKNRDCIDQLRDLG
ncbi:MAG: hypothetical protein BGO39_20685 [Chloroflexi bacterium 54-19]|nr:MAG: hypothetical protein BGO39_20685 [Chloroflexi bacterium 54-19]